MTHTKEFLIFELQRFHEKNGVVPKFRDMTLKNGYPSGEAYRRHFKIFNNALEIAGFEINQTCEKRTGLETCRECNNYLKENEYWITKGLPVGQVMCLGCYDKSKSAYKKGNLDKNSNTGKGTISEQIVKNVLGLENKYDCNFACGFGYKIDLFDKEKYKFINVKSGHLQKDNAWHFDLIQKEMPDTYIMLGYDENRKNILRVWITDPLDDLVYDEKNGRQKTGIGITNDVFTGLNRAKPWEVDAKPYDDMLHQMSKKRKETNGINCFLDDDDL